jgi:hypothetical protein
MRVIVDSYSKHCGGGGHGGAELYSIMSRSLNEAKYFIVDSILSHITSKEGP